ncbi:hypothetical protein Tco_1284271 [Tanacetum coccineum]
MNESLTSMVYSRVNEATKTIVPVYVAKGLLMEKPRMQAEVAQIVADVDSSFRNKYTTDDDELPTKKVSQELVEEMSEIVDETKLRKVVGEMLRQRCTSGDEHQYHNDQMKKFLKNDIVWESKKEILSSPYPQKPTLVIQSCQRDPIAPALSLINQDLLYLKKGNSYISELGHERKFVTEIIVRRANERISSITEPDYKNLNKNDIEDMYLLCMESYQHNFNLTAPTINFPGIKKKKMFSIITEPIHGIIYMNSKKEKRVMGHHEIHKFCDAALERVLEGLKSYNNNVKHAYMTPSLSKDDVEYL